MSKAKFRTALLGFTLVTATSAFGAVTPAYAAADGCAAGVQSDFNGDGRSDAAVGDAYATVSGLSEAGRVVVMYGDSDGLVGQGSQTALVQGGAGVGGIAESGDRFGAAIAAADLNCDGYTDLVVGVPKEDISGQSDSGYVQIIWGAAGGLATGASARTITQLNLGLTVHAGDQFGYAVDALEDVGQGGTPNPDAYAVAIGAPGYDVNGHNDAGLVGFLAAFDGGNVTSSVTQDSPGMPGAAEDGDRFGAAVSLNYLSGDDGLVDAAVGVPNEDIGTRADAGGVTIVEDIYDTPESGVGFDQNSSGVAGDAEAGDYFGRSLDTVQVGGTSRLAVGVPGEDVGKDANAGMVQLFTSDGEDLDPTVGLSQDTAGVGDTTESGDEFGDKVAFAAPGLGDTVTRLAVSAPKENGAATDTGLVQVFPVTDLDNEVSWTQGSPNVPGTPQAGEKFGSSLAVVEGAAERVLLVGVPDDVGYNTGMVEVIPFGAGLLRFWAPGLDGGPAAGAARFGSALASVTG
jgi:hypothetical protein